jgi:hypothetical protein
LKGQRLKRIVGSFAAWLAWWISPSWILWKSQVRRYNLSNALTSMADLNQCLTEYLNPLNGSGSPGKRKKVGILSFKALINLVRNLGRHCG